MRLEPDLIALLTCLESDLNRHYAVFETALSTVGVPRLDLIQEYSSDRQEQRH
jgi:hypothetical protein